MSVYRRRYDRNEIIKLMFDTSYRKMEEDRFLLTSRGNMIEEDFIVFFNFIILCCARSYHDKLIDKNEFYKIIDKADAYLFAFEDGLLNGLSLYNKFKEIMENDLFVRDWNYKVLYEEV